MDKLQNKLKSDTNTNSISLLLKILVVLMSLSILVLSILLYFEMQEESKVAVLKEDGTPAPSKIVEQKIGYLVDHKKFLTLFIHKIYTFSGDNYIQQIRSAFPYMTSDLQKKFIEGIEEDIVTEEGLHIYSSDNVNSNNLTSNITNLQIKEDTLKRSGNGYLIKAEGYKLEVRDFMTNKTPIEIEISFKLSEVTNENYWGIKVFQIKERIKND